MHLRQPHSRFATVITWISAAAGCIVLFTALHHTTIVRARQEPTPPRASTHNFTGPHYGESPEQAAAASTGCITCHTGLEHPNMHIAATVMLGCTDCHSGDASITNTAAAASPEYEAAERKAHIQPRLKENAAHGGHPVRAYTHWIEESPEFVRFANPGDLRIAATTCGVCHAAEVRNVKSSMMTHGAMLWEAALYNNGAFPLKNAHFGESYDINGKPERLRTFPPPTAEETRAHGILPYLDPLQRWEVSEPGNLLRVFERGGEKRSEIGNPNTEESSGQPDLKLGDRGLGTELRTDPVFLGLQKTRLLDPLLYFPGTNDQPGDFRASGCSGCHVLYANDRDPAHSEQIAAFGNSGHTQSTDPAINKSESGHPLQHVFTRQIPSSQCMTCHIHPGTNMETTYYGYTWWDNEANGDAMYPAHQHNPTAQQAHDVAMRNPEGSAARGKWSDPKFLEQIGTPQFNAKIKDTQFADFHSHGWVFRAVYKRDRHGHLLDQDGKLLPNDEDLGKAVHLKDIHLEKGMQCVDCHYTQDVHGNGKLYGETRNAVEIGCVDCHGTIEAKATLKTSGPASAHDASSNLLRLRTPFGQARFYWRDGKLFQRSNVVDHREWEVVQVLDSITPGNAHYSEKSRLAKTLQKDGVTWGHVADMKQLAHSDQRMTCYSCHSSWTTSCFGCHLSMTADQKTPMLHNEGQTTRNYTNYNFMVLRDDVYMLGVDGTVTGNRIAPVRSACAIVVSSQNANRNWLYQQQQTISSPGFSGQAFSTYVPHTVRAKETKGCTDCHVARNGDNNAWMAQLLVEGTNFLNFMGKYIYVANGKAGFSAVPVAASTEPPAIAGSDLQHMAYPSDYASFVANGRKLRTAYEHGGNVLDLQLRGEYLYAAMGHDGFRIFDVANVDVKDISQRVITAPVSPLGQEFYLKTKNAAAIATPSTLALDPLRKQLPENEEQAIAPLYAFLYVADREEGLIVVGDPKSGVGTLLDGNPRNNFLKRAATFNPNGALTGARRITIAGDFAYILCNRGLAVVDLSDPLHPKITAEVGDLVAPQGIAIQFRYAFVVDREGLKVFDVTHLDHPIRTAATLPLEDARNIYVARTYAYVSAGKNGIAIVDVEHPEQSHLEQMFNAGGQLNDTNDLKIGMVSSSQFAFVADGKNGMRIVQLFSSKSEHTFYGFSPKPTPELIATHSTSQPALAISKGVDRDRAVDESGNQLTVFGRRGARPLNREEQERMYLHAGQLYTVTDAPPNTPQ
ncbi:MAG: multiheme c-type cytochrome [Acidobacteriota bacterium]